MLIEVHAEFVTLRAAARATGISRSLVLQAVRLGQISAYRPGTRWVYVHLDDVRAWLRHQRVAPSGNAVDFARELISEQEERSSTQTRRPAAADQR